jgi:class 3 adenylate cyclase/predicted ATPase
MTDLQKWLDDIGLGQYADLFAKNDIDHEVLQELDDQDLIKLGISFGHRKKLLKAVAAYHSPASGVSPRLDEVRRIADAIGVKPERRHLTMLFCDIVGSTALSARLDPEDLRQILHEFQSCCSDAIRRYEGHIARFMGDGVLAYFGFPTAHEDDAERAVNTALRIVECVSASVPLAAHRIEVRIGIATGLVVVGDLIGEGPTREFAIVGEAPNLAASLQQFAKPNQILISPRTMRLIGSLFELQDIGNHSIKGLNQQVRVYRVLKTRAVGSRFEAHRSSHLTPLVGRDPELAVLEERYRKAERGAGQLMLITGEPGIGKSRLVTALRHRLDEESCCQLVLQCASYHTSSAWYPVIRYLEDAAGISGDTPPGLRLQKLEALTAQHVNQHSEWMMPLLAALLSIPTQDRYAPLKLTPPEQKNQTFVALLTLFEALTRDRAAVLIFEDVHWIDPTSLALLERVRDRMQDWRMLVIVLFRPELTLAWTDRPYITSLFINRLDRAQVALMIDSVPGAGALSRSIIGQIVAKADGVPLFVEEMTKAVIEAGATGGGRTTANLRSPLAVPDSLHESLMARLDQLASMKIAAQVAAAIGREFSLKLLEAVAPLSRRGVEAAIDRLLASGLVFQSGLPSQKNYTFKHTLVQDEAYASMLRDARRELHGKIAEVLSTESGEVSAATPELIAHHYTQSGQLNTAIEYWLKAGRQASERSAFVEASTHLQNALNVLATLPAAPERDKLELKLQHSLGSALAASKGFGAAETNQAFKRALELCNKIEGSTLTTSVLNGLIGVHVARGEFEQSRDLAEDLLARARRQEDPTPRLMGHRALGMSLFLIGELAPARDQLLNSLARHGPLPLAFSQDFKATAQAYLALASVLLGDIRGGLANGREAVTHAEQLRHPHSICYALSFWAGAYVLCRDPEAARPIAERTVALAHEYEFPLWLAGGQMLRGWSRFDLGDVEQGLAEIRQSVNALEAAGAPIWVQFARYLLAQALAKTDQTQEAMALVGQTLFEIGTTSGRWYEAELHRLKGDLLLDRGDSPAAENSYETAIAVSARQGARLWQLRATNSLGSLWRTQAKLARLHKRLAPLYASFDKEMMIADLKEAKVLLNEAA